MLTFSRLKNKSSIKMRKRKKLRLKEVFNSNVKIIQQYIVQKIKNKRGKTCTMKSSMHIQNILLESSFH